jgi:hypothetical protein
MKINESMLYQDREWLMKITAPKHNERYISSDSTDFNVKYSTS